MDEPIKEPRDAFGLRTQ